MIKKLIFFIHLLFIFECKLAMAEKNLFQITCGKIGYLLFLWKKGNIEIKNFTEEFIQKNQCEFDDRNLKVIFFENYKNSNYQISIIYYRQFWILVSWL